jgi:hypothetical protein
LVEVAGIESETPYPEPLVNIEDSDFSTRGVYQDVDCDFWDSSSDAGTNCPNKGQSQRRVEEDGFEGGGVGYPLQIILGTITIQFF